VREVTALKRIASASAVWMAAGLAMITLAWADVPPPSGEAARLFCEAETLLRQGDADAAAGRYAEALAASAGDPAIMAGRVRALLQGDRWREAFEEARRFADSKPGDPVLEAALGEALMRGGRLQEADSVLAAQASLERPDPRGLLTLGLLRAAQGRSEGRELVERALSLAPDDRYVLFWASGAASTRAAAVDRLERYLAISEGDDPDRIEAARGKVRLYRALGERPLWLGVERPERMEMPLRLIRGDRGRTLGYGVDAVIGEGRAITLLLDSGSPGLFVGEKALKRMGFEPLAEETLFGGGGDRRHRAVRGTVASVEIGGLKFADCLLTASPDLDRIGFYQGILGLNVFDGYRLTLDLIRLRLLLDREPPEEAAEPYWNVGGQILVAAGDTRGNDGLFLLDTGATRSVVSHGFARSSGAPTREVAAPARGYGGPMQGTLAVRGLTLRFQGIPTPSSTLHALDLSLQSRLGGVELSGFLGLDLLGGRTLILDSRTQTVAVIR
jgi:tetratricopeptide (TPR) repeat protein